MRQRKKWGVQGSGGCEQEKKQRKEERFSWQRREEGILQRMPERGAD
jgi:hypothetical protein